MKKVVLFVLIVSSVLFSISSCKKEEKDPCEAVSCLNGGTCNNGSCACAAGYEGAQCQTEIREKFIGLYETSGCDGEIYLLSISNSTDEILNVLLEFSGINLPPISATINGNSMTIPSQIFTNSNSVITRSGAGSLNGNVLSWTLVTTVDPSIPWEDTYTESCIYLSYKF